jgi:MFS family permease
MYAIDWAGVCGRRGDTPATTQPRVQVSRTVWALGFTSLLTDVSSEMVSSVLPMYLVLHLGLSPLAFGVIDGLYNGAAALARLAGGVAADWWRRHKEVAASGYALSAISRIALVMVGGASPLLAAVVVTDRIGKGIRTAPRDALIALETRPDMLGAAFGVHRALDATGALLGPLVAMSVLMMMPGGFDVVFVWSFCFAIVGLAVLMIFVDRRTSDRRDRAARIGFGETLALMSAPRFRALTFAASALGFATMSDAFIYLVLQQQGGFGAAFFPLLYVATALCNAAVALPVGRLADRIGRVRVCLGGYGLLLVLYAVLITTDSGMVRLALVPMLLGAYYAATDGVLTAMTSQTMPSRLCGTALGIVGTLQNVARLTASILFGWLWMQFGWEAAIGCFVVMLTAAMFYASMVLQPGRARA